MARPKSVGFIRAMLFCPNCNGSTVKLWHITDRSSSRRETTLCGHCQTSLEVFLFLKVQPLPPAVAPSLSEHPTAS